MRCLFAAAVGLVIAVAPVTAQLQSVRVLVIDRRQVDRILTRTPNQELVVLIAFFVIAGVFAS